MRPNTPPFATDAINFTPFATVWFCWQTMANRCKKSGKYVQILHRLPSMPSILHRLPLFQFDGKRWQIGVKNVQILHRLPPMPSILHTLSIDATKPPFYIVFHQIATKKVCPNTPSILHLNDMSKWWHRWHIYRRVFTVCTTACHHITCCYI